MADLVVDNLTKEYPTRGEPLVVLRGVSLQLDVGQSLAIVGPSGSGKSTLLQLIGALDRPTSGEVRLRGEDPFALDDVHLAQFRNRRVGFVFQDHHLLPQLSALENVLVPTLAAGRSSRDDLQRASQLLEAVGLTDRIDHRPSELSGGERQRVAIARAMVRQPTLLLADEPTGNLDRRTAASISQLLLRLVQQAESPTILIVVTHSQELASQMQQCQELQDGRLNGVQ